ncbi:MAG: N-acetylglucosamine-6-phosphate deacetylase [Oscillospiraceae bacterium]|nr:N-acetylglucosamine-6-phosphate deacetylase [Oscillospiraceae bacterium]
MFYKNARIFCCDFQFRMGAFEVTDEGKFGAILADTVPEDAIDLGGATVIPGLCDVHNHGNSGEDFSDGNYDGLVKIARYLAREGVTSFAPASMTLPYEVLEKAFATGKMLADRQPEGCSRIMGIQMEGPYFSEKKKGAQNGAYLKAPDFAGFKKLYDSCGGLVRIADLAPELPGAVEFAEQASKLCTVSVAHTDSDYNHAKAAFDAGATHLTHLFNGMPSIHHRNPGVIPAAVENPNVRAEIICDGLHIHPASVRLAFSAFGADRMIIISDALRCCGMPDGEYELGGQQVFLCGGIAKLADGTIAGSATNLYECMRRAMDFGIAEENAIRASSYNPACALGAEDKIGSIETGKYADFLVCSPDYRQKTVYMGGKAI